MRSRFATGFVAVAAALAIAGCETGVLAPVGPVGRAQRTILLNSLTIMLAIVIPTMIASLLVAWWFRDSNRRARYRPQFVYSGRIELIVWSIPTLVILFLGGVIWVSSHQLDPFRPLESPQAPLEVQVVALDWKWLFIYPEQRVASVNELVIPVGRPVHFSLTSASVMNAFFIPQLGGMIATMNRMVTQLHLQADHPGRYFGQSAQFSGDGFADMHFEVRAVPDDAFVDWIATTRRSGPVLDRRSYQAIAVQSQNVAPITYRDADPRLFQAIVTHEIPPSAGPQVGIPGPAVRPTSER